MITQQELLKMFEYRDGDLYWKINIPFNNTLGKKAGTLNKRGYTRIKIKDKPYLMHRLIFLMHHGHLPKAIDHIDGCQSNSRIENLRAATLSQNQHNAKLSKTNKSGVKGVSWNSLHKKWSVNLTIDNKQKYFGEYYDIEVAKFVADTMRHKYHGKFANNGTT